MRRSVGHLDNVEVVGFSKLVVEVARDVDADDISVSASADPVSRTFAVKVALAELRAAHPGLEVTEAFNFVDPVQEEYDGSMHLLYEGALLAVVVRLALWLAQNIVAERSARQDWPNPDMTSQEEVFADRGFVVRQEIKATPNPLFRRLEVSVASREEPARTLQRSVAFLILIQ